MVPLQTAQRGITPLGQSENFEFATHIRFCNFVKENTRNRDAETSLKYFSGVAGSFSFNIMYFSCLAIACLASW